MREKSLAMEELLFQYTHLLLGGKKVRCPYWMDKLKKGISGPFGGKGSPEQIVEATLVAARKEGVNLAELSSSQIKAFMRKNRIGIDCSGLVFNLLNALDKEKGGKGLADEIPGARGKFLVRANVRMLTNRNVSSPIRQVAALRVRDIIRLGGGRHIALIVNLRKDGKGKIREIIYAHSSPKTRVSGVHLGKIKVINEQKGLSDQEWREKTKKGENYRHYFQPEKGDGIRRLKIWV